LLIFAAEQNSLDNDVKVELDPAGLLDAAVPRAGARHRVDGRMGKVREQSGESYQMFNSDPVVLLNKKSGAV